MVRIASAVASHPCTACSIFNKALLSLTQSYDYIVTGAGCAGLSLVMRLLASDELKNKKILLIDVDAKAQNDRTWCFWESEPDLFEPVVYKRWNHLLFYSDSYSSELGIAPYQYKLIRGIDFYTYCLQEIKSHPNVTFLQQKVASLHSSKGETYAVVNGEKYYAQYIFNSILFQKPLLNKKEYWLLQHFKGWIVETSAPSFDAEIATLMDFRTAQNEGATFFYVLPFSANKALIEYTAFSKSVWPDETYEAALKDYVENNLQIKNYTVKEKEFGVIPMSNYRFPVADNNIIHIGTAGGQTKASSGYTFKFIQKSSKSIVEALRQKKHPAIVLKPKERFRFYDAVLLYILHHNTLPGNEIFATMFKKNDPSLILRFLDNETTLLQDIKIIASLPTLPFLKAAIKQQLPY